MILTKVNRVFSLALFCALVTISAPPALCQESQSSRAASQREEDANLDMQIYLILASNRDVEDAKLPPALDPIVKRLREALNFRHYNLAATFLDRVKNNGRLEVSWVGGPFVVPGSAATTNPSFSQFTSSVKLVTDEAGHEIVRLSEFRFGMRVPIATGQTTTASAPTNAAIPAPIINYEPVGLRTDLSMREGSLVIAGTLNVGPSGDAIIVVVSARRAN